MINLDASRAWWLAVGPRLERGVRPRPAALARAVDLGQEQVIPALPAPRVLRAEVRRRGCLVGRSAKNAPAGAVCGCRCTRPAARRGACAAPAIAASASGGAPTFCLCGLCVPPTDPASAVGHERLCRSASSTESWALPIAPSILLPRTRLRRAAGASTGCAKSPAIARNKLIPRAPKDTSACALPFVFTATPKRATATKCWSCLPGAPNRKVGFLRGLTFELRRDRRQSARPGGRMINLTWSRGLAVCRWASARTRG